MVKWVSRTAMVAVLAAVAGGAFAQPAPAPAQPAQPAPAQPAPAQPAPAQPAAPAQPPPVQPPAPVHPVQAMFDRWIADLAADRIEASYATFAVLGDRAIVTGFSIINEATQNGVAFDTITLSGYQDLPPTGFSFDELTIDHLEARVGTAEIEVVAVNVSNVVMPETGFAIDPDRPFSSVVDIFGLVAATSLDEATIGRVDVTQDMGGLNSVTTYHNYLIRGWADGRVASVSAGPVIIESPYPDGLLSMTVAKVESTDTDLAAIPYIFDLDQYENGVGNPEWRTAVGRASYAGIVAAAPGFQMRVRGITLEDFRVRQSDRPVADVLDQLIANGGEPDEALDAMAGELLLDFIMPYGIGRFAIDGIDIYAEDLDRFHLGEFHIADLSLDGLGEIGFSDLDVVVGGQGGARVDRFALGGVVMPDRDVLREAIRTGVETEDMDQVFALVPTVGYVEIGGLEFGAMGELPFTVGRILLENGGYVGPIPTSWRVEVADFGAPLTLLPADIRRILGELGYTEATANAVLDMAWEEKTGTLAVNDLSLSLAGAGSFQLSMRFGGITREMLENAGDFAPDAVTLIDGRIVVTDETVADRLFAWTAEGTNQPAAQYRDEFIRGLPFLMSVMMDREIAARLAPAIQEFLREPGTMTLTMAPAAPVPLTEIEEQDPNDIGALIELLGITIENTPR
ncbi:MAG: hypothetical protein AB7O56_14820 [Bauldia sp.]